MRTYYTGPSRVGLLQGAQSQHQVDDEVDGHEHDADHLEPLTRVVPSFYINGSPFDGVMLIGIHELCHTSGSRQVGKCLAMSAGTRPYCYEFGF